MNKESPSRKRRSYDNTLRLEQAKQTRERILDSAVKVLESAGWKGASLANVAREAGVSEPTLYRHFRSRERLLVELEARTHGKLGFPGFPETADQLASHVDTLFGKFEEHAPWLRASMQSGLGQEMLARGRAARLRRMRELVETLAPDLEKEQVARVTGVLRVLASWESFDRLTRELGLSRRDASEAVSWALKTLIENPPDGTGIGNGRPSSKTKRSTKRTSAKGRRA
jgi:AcrR family transcriptional regulator